mgnify:CR=1 FL=1|tara:strand:- start:408 stop:1178 length:771 start_codon:yes stop_codon:yes gene_type:complete
MKILINKLLKFFNLELIKKNVSGVIDKRNLTPFQKDNKYYNLYFEGLEKSQNQNTDNFFKQCRHLDLINLALIALKKEVVADFAEAGCWKGHSSYFLSKLINDYNFKKNKNIKFFIFDSFEGLSEINEKDKNVKKLDQNLIKKIKTQFVSDDQFVKNEVLKDFKFVEIFKGWIPEKFDKVKDKKFSFVHIDVDLYEPTLQSLEFFFPRLIEGGIIVCDDYNSFGFDGAKKAWDEFFNKNKVKINFSPTVSGSFIIK